MNAVFEHNTILQPTPRQLRTSFDAEHGVQWTYMNPEGRPCFNRGLLIELLHHYENTEITGSATDETGAARRIAYDVLCSDHEDAFNLGGDLDFFGQCIRKADREALLAYATLCIENVWNRLRRYGRGITTIALIQGKALGGGLEAALASEFVIAERGAQLGLPEVLFNLFPGMGAYSILSRRLGQRRAEELILSGRLYSAEELHALGVVDVLADDGHGEVSALEFIRTHQRRANARRALAKCRDLMNPITHKELMDVTTEWVDAALRLETRDLKMMERLVVSQNKLSAAATTAHSERSMQTGSGARLQVVA